MFSAVGAGVQAPQTRDPKNGRFQLNGWFNSYQAPQPFVDDQSRTWAPNGKKRVAVSQPFAGLEKRQCTVEHTAGPDGKIMRCAIIFRATGKRISLVEKVAYDPRVDVSSRITRGPTAISACRRQSVAFSRA